MTIVGASGCGKTTFLKMLLGMEQPTRGQILIDGVPIRPEPDPDRGVVFQRYSSFPHLTVLENVMLGLELRSARFVRQGCSARRGAKRARRRWPMLESVGLARVARPLSGAALRRHAAAHVDRAGGDPQTQDPAAR